MKNHKKQDIVKYRDILDARLREMGFIVYWDYEDGGGVQGIQYDSGKRVVEPGPTLKGLNWFQLADLQESAEKWASEIWRKYHRPYM